MQMRIPRRWRCGAVHLSGCEVNVATPCCHCLVCRCWMTLMKRRMWTVRTLSKPWISRLSTNALTTSVRTARTSPSGRVTCADTCASTPWSSDLSAPCAGRNTNIWEI
jgi:hypothetical protein